MGVAFDDWISAEKRGAVEGGAHLANTPADALDRTVAKDDQGFGIPLVQADITEHFGH